jgi:anti-anti-sigma factor
MESVTVSERGAVSQLALHGRLDSMTAPAVQREIAQLVLDGARQLLIDLNDVSFVSSAGLRVFIAAQQQLSQVGGEVVLVALSGQTEELLRLSGLLDLFRVVDSAEQARPADGGKPPGGTERTVAGIPLQISERTGAQGRISIIGSADKLARAAYGESDLHVVKASEMRFGAGLAAIGSSFAECRELFGEAVVLDHSLFFHPAVRRPTADFMLASRERNDIAYSFLHGFGFDGDFRYVARFSPADGALQLSELLSAVFELSPADLLGVVLLCESRGLLGMHLKRVPLAENQPASGTDIFDPRSFSDWMSFPVEPTDVSNLVVATGIAARDPRRLPPQVEKLFAPDTRAHLHAAVFGKRPLDLRIERFDAEFERVTHALEVQRVEHLLGASRLGCGLVSVIELGS